MTEYEAALAKHNDAIRAFDAVRAAYRAGAVNDAEFLRARRIYKAADAEFDAAYAKAAGWQT